MGDPIEPFHGVAEVELRRAWGLEEASYAAYLDAVLDHTRSPNGCGGVKVMWSYLDHFMGRLADVDRLHDMGDGVERFGAVFAGSRAIHLTRRNKVRAAISNWIALTTDQWYLHPGLDRATEPEVADHWAISRLHAELHAAAHGWPLLLTAAGIPHATVHYEDWSADARLEVARTSRLVLGIDVDGEALPEPQMMVQATAFTDVVEATWIERTGGCPACSS
jgi:LPS sulfotransferase NodH